MEPREYIVENINGDYAYLRRTDSGKEEEVFPVAMALLPGEIDVGTRLRREMLEYAVIG